MYSVSVLTVLYVIHTIWSLSNADATETESQENKGTEKQRFHVGPEDIAIVIRDQLNKYHAKRALKLKENLLDQAAPTKPKGSLDILLLQKELLAYAGWTILPIIPRLNEMYGNKKKWIFFCEENSNIVLPKLLQVLSRFNSDKPMFLGHALADREPSIIHHFAFIENPAFFKYPDFSAGWAISVPLLQSLQRRLSSNPIDPDFNIDVQYEVAMYIYQDGKGQILTSVPEFCINPPPDSTSCATATYYEEPKCGSVDVNDIFVAVKTCEKFHKERIPVIEKTVHKETRNLVYFSDIADPSIPTEVTGIANTERGHCAKLFKILEIVEEREELNDKKWVVVIDDDTIMSFSRLRKVLACYDHNEAILLGERYGYGINDYSYGYDYITGGGGMILTRPAIRLLLNANCACPSIDTPDDMWMGNCFKRIGVPLVHNPAFHQARPMEYSEEFLEHQYLVSFHKHYNLDPMDVYSKYLASPSKHKPKDEL